MKLAPNKNKALAVYNSQLKKLSKNPTEKDDVIKSEAKLQTLGHVEYVRNLTEEQQKRLKDNPIQNYIPWLSVWNENSMTTPCRVVFNASQSTSSSFNLNDILAKGRNNMNKLVEIMIRWRQHKHAFHTDVQKMYNSVQLVEEDWCLQRYIWRQNLDPAIIPEQKVIKTLIYGIKSSGNQAERGLRMTAELSKDDYPEVNNIVQKDIYVDDCMSGESSSDMSFQRADELSLVLRRGGFCLKGFTFSGKRPLHTLSENGKSINVAGMKWFSEPDELQLDMSELNFQKRHRGKRVQGGVKHEIPSILTRRHCVSKVAEIFDLMGMITPITSMMKLDLHTLVQRKLDWDDVIPDDLRMIWNSHFDMLKEINGIKFKRAIVPNDATSLDIDTIDTGDASKSIACVAIYARFLKSTGEYSCQLVFGRSKLIPEGMTTPRAELLAANLNAHTGEVVKRSFQKHHRKALKLTDSQITLHWINNVELPLKQWVRNRVVEISRFSDQSMWKYVKSSDMPADIGTRRVSSMEDVSPGSPWTIGYNWMHKDASAFPVKTYDEVKLSCTELSDVRNEMVLHSEKKRKLTVFAWPQEANFTSNYAASSVKGVSLPVGIKSRYEFSNYIIDPNKFRFQTVLRILALVKKFIDKCKLGLQRKQCSKNDLVLSTQDKPLESTHTKTESIISESELQEASNYYFRKASLEVKKFNAKESYQTISSEKDGILYYNGRILPSQEISAVVTLSDVMRDLKSTTFCVPLIDKHSPLAYSITNEIHWYHKVAKHAGVETVLRYTMQYGYILEGRELVKRIRKACERCRLLAKRTIDVSMGPVSNYNLTIAPAFYITQVDIAGPFKAYSPHNKRGTIKIWLIVFCCTTTSTTSIKVMEDYSTTAFLQAFIRISCEVGYPKLILTDGGSQLVRGCETMKLNYQAVQRKLHLEMKVELETCPVGGHNMHGKVERKIKHIKESIDKSIQNERLSILQWETLVSEIANSINDLPLALGSIVADLENLDLITPNRLRLGRNNDRSPVGPLFVTHQADKFLKLNVQIFNAWFESWLISHVPKLMKQPKWFDNDRDISEGDIVLFLKQEGSYIGGYQYGMVKSLHKSKDGIIRSVNLKYRNYKEKVDRVTCRAVRQLVMIHSVDELDIISELGEVATAADMKLKLQHT